ncbi:hypothetical protein [Erwinia aphidicola]|uniref:hypothetical protein n=1 Tax=Erwinia aphidicola TaxID=68334 RepID=UPI0020A0CD9C|nr:hypothetical protein [Erwinia aphidicola]MCP2230171.1 dsRNA-specific ribonuclease [Erwinia aphidicola]
MNAQVSINIPRVWVYPEEFAFLEKMSIHTVYKWTEQGKVKNIPKSIRKGCKRVGGRSQIKYFEYVQEKTRAALGHSNFVINVTGAEINVPDGYRASKRTAEQ